MPIKNIFFDIDGVLFSTAEFADIARKNALNAMVTMGLNAPYQKLRPLLCQVIEKKGSNSRSHFDSLLENLGVEKRIRPRMVAAAVGAYHDTKAMIQPYPEVPRILQSLKEAHFRLFCASEGIEVKQWDKLNRMHIALFFEDVFVTRAKNTAFYLKIAKASGGTPSECVMIGDREEKDIAPAKKAGMHAIRIRREGSKYAGGPTAADAEVDSLGEIEGALEKI